MYHYYLTQRPPSIGTYPREGVVAVEAYDGKKVVADIGRMAWGKVTYAEPLTERQVYDFELTPSPKNRKGKQ